jgi:hypothetical protein
VFKLVARFRGEHWLLTPDESYDLSRGIAGVFVFLPIDPEQSALFIAVNNLAVATIRVAGSRVLEDRLRARVAQVMAANPYITKEQAEAAVLSEIFAGPQPQQPQANGQNP